MSSIHCTTDGRAFIYTDYRDGVTNLRLQPLEGGAARPLTTYAREVFYSFDISRDGRLLLANGLTTSDVVLFKEPRCKSETSGTFLSQTFRARCFLFAAPLNFYQGRICDED